MFRPSENRTAAPTAQPATSPAEEDFQGRIIDGKWKVDRTVGKGSYGKVYLARSTLQHGLVAALKFIPKANLKKPSHFTRLKREISLISAMQHPNVIRLYDQIETEEQIILVMEYADGGDLYDLINNGGRPPGQKQPPPAEGPPRLSETLARCLFRQIVAALEYCHHYNIIHRDIKPENVMLSMNGTELHAKLIDFGFANIYDPSGHLRTNCGSPLYACPQIIQGVEYVGPDVDIWSLGITLYAMLTGLLPFEDPSLKGLYSKICAGRFSIPAHVSPDARSLIQRMLVVEPSQRIVLDQIKEHPWFGPSEVTVFRDPYIAGSLRESIVDTICANFGFQKEDATYSDITKRINSPARGMYQLLYAKEIQSDGAREKTAFELRKVEEGMCSPPMTPMKDALKRANQSPINRVRDSIRRWVGH